MGRSRARECRCARSEAAHGPVAPHLGGDRDAPVMQRPPYRSLPKDRKLSAETRDPAPSFCACTVHIAAHFALASLRLRTWAGSTDCAPRSTGCSAVGRGPHRLPTELGAVDRQRPHRRGLRPAGHRATGRERRMPRTDDPHFGDRPHCLRRLRSESSSFPDPERPASDSVARPVRSPDDRDGHQAEQAHHTEGEPQRPRRPAQRDERPAQETADRVPTD